MKVNNFTVVESIYGKVVVNRNCDFQIDALAKTGVPHIESELQTIFKLLELLPNDSIIIDGGANIGLFAIPVAQQVKERGIRVIAFEPQRMLFSALSGSIVLNDLTNLWVHNKALGQQPGEVTLPVINYNQRQDYGLVQVKEEHAADENPYMNNRIVPSVSIDSLNLPHVEFIKLDVEGFECPAILGAHETIKKFRPLLWVEYFITGQQQITNTFAGIDGYKFVIMDGQNMLCYPDEKLKVANQ